MTLVSRLKRSLSTLTLGVAAAFVAHCGDDEPSCDELFAEAANRRSDIYTAPGNSSCTSDADCVAVYHRMRCVADCGDPSSVSRSAVDHLAAEVAAVERDVCGRSDQQSCVSIELPCGAGPDPALALAVCRRGQCGLDHPPED